MLKTLDRITNKHETVSITIVGTLLLGIVGYYSLRDFFTSPSSHQTTGIDLPVEGVEKKLFDYVHDILLGTNLKLVEARIKDDVRKDATLETIAAARRYFPSRGELDGYYLGVKQFGGTPTDRYLGTRTVGDKEVLYRIVELHDPVGKPSLGDAQQVKLRGTKIVVHGYCESWAYRKEKGQYVSRLEAIPFEDILKVEKALEPIRAHFKAKTVVVQE